MNIRDDQVRRPKIIDESGSEISLWLNTREDLIISIRNIKSFNEQKRVIIFLKTMLNMYLLLIHGDDTYSQYFTVNENIKKLFQEEEDIEEGIEEGTQGDALIQHLLSMDTSSSSEEDVDFSDMDLLVDFIIKQNIRSREPAFHRSQSFLVDQPTHVGEPDSAFCFD